MADTMTETMTETHSQDHDLPAVYTPRNVCFGCGSSNPHGLQMKFVLSLDGKGYSCEFELGSSFGGPPGHAHGGIIATILDEAMSKAIKLKSKVALTRRMEVEYLRPVPLGQPLLVEGRICRMVGRALYNSAEIRDAKGEILARSRGTFVTINPEKMFARELEKEQCITS